MINHWIKHHRDKKAKYNLIAFCFTHLTEFDIDCAHLTDLLQKEFSGIVSFNQEGEFVRLIVDHADVLIAGYIYDGSRLRRTNDRFWVF